MLKAHEAITDFLETAHRYTYPQPLVAEAIGAKQTDLNTWRSRGLMTGWDKETSRVEYTGRGLIAAGWMNELSFYGPAQAAFMADAFAGWALSSGNFETDDKFVELRRSPFEASEIAGENIVKWRDLGLYPLMTDRKEHGPVIAKERMIGFALNDLSRKWAVMARLLMNRMG